MEDIRFRCPGCRGKLVVDARYAGETASCPKCSLAVAIPRPRPGEAEDLAQPLKETRRALKETRRTLDQAVAREKDTVSQAAELATQLDEAAQTLARAEKAHTEKAAEFEGELKREKAALALQIQAHKKLELEAEDLAHQAENAARERVEALNKEVESRALQVEQLQHEMKNQREALASREAELAAMKKQQPSQGGKPSSSADVKRLEEELEAQRQAANEIEKDKAILFDEVSGLRKKVKEQEELLSRSETSVTASPRASRNDFAEGQMRILDQKLTDQLATLDRQLTEVDASEVGEDTHDGLSRMQAETQRLAKAHSIQLEVQRLERKLREEQQMNTERSRKETEQRLSELSGEVEKLRAQLEVKDHAMREVVDGARTPIDLSGYANPTLERLAAAQAEQQAASDDGEKAPADGTLTPLKDVGEDLLPRFTSPRPYYHELPQAQPRKSWVLTLGWILAGFGIIAMILSPAKLLPVYAPPVAVALLLGVALWFRRRTPMVAGLVFLTILIPAMVWFGVEQAHFEGLAPELGVDVGISAFK